MLYSQRKGRISQFGSIVYPPAGWGWIRQGACNVMEGLTALLPQWSAETLRLTCQRKPVA
ncbi:MAG: hypothetical protein PVI90_06965 [Desulfobacteraceae bacterium]